MLFDPDAKELAELRAVNKALREELARLNAQCNVRR